ncbi:MAG: ceramidase [Acidimicrobiales bacterium]|nr:ceramidase [Acidimicrobiales bacterium]
MSAEGPSRRRHVAAADCERCRDGWVAQPANTLSSLAFVLAAAPLASRRPDPAGRLVAATAVAAGLGSVAYHGPGTVAGRYLHDAGLLAMLGAMALDDATAIDRRTPPTPALVGVTAAAAVLAGPRTSGGAQIVVGALAVGAALYRTARRGVRRRDVIGEALLVGGAALHTLGRTGGPLCRPDSPLPAHAVWHVAAAASVALRHG